MQRLEDRVAVPAAGLRLRPLDGGLGAEVLGLPVADVDASNFPDVHAAFLKHQLLLFRDQDLPPAAQVAFARRFGEVQMQERIRLSKLQAFFHFYYSALWIAADNLWRF